MCVCVCVCVLSVMNAIIHPICNSKIETIKEDFSFFHEVVLPFHNIKCSAS